MESKLNRTRKHRDRNENIKIKQGRRESGNIKKKKKKHPDSLKLSKSAKVVPKRKRSQCEEIPICQRQDNLSKAKCGNVLKSIK